jgi:hypothetical protein
MVQDSIIRPSSALNVEQKCRKSHVFVLHAAKLKRKLRFITFLLRLLI